MYVPTSSTSNAKSAGWYHVQVRRAIGWVGLRTNRCCAGDRVATVNPYRALESGGEAQRAKDREKAKGRARRTKTIFCDMLLRRSERARCLAHGAWMSENLSPRQIKDHLANWFKAKALPIVDLTYLGNSEKFVLHLHVSIPIILSGVFRVTLYLLEVGSSRVSPCLCFCSI